MYRGPGTVQCTTNVQGYQVPGTAIPTRKYQTRINDESSTFVSIKYSTGTQRHGFARATREIRSSLSVSKNHTLGLNSSKPRKLWHRHLRRARIHSDNVMLNERI